MLSNQFDCRDRTMKNDDMDSSTLMISPLHTILVFLMHFSSFPLAVLMPFIDSTISPCTKFVSVYL